MANSNSKALIDCLEVQLFDSVLYADHAERLYRWKMGFAKALTERLRSNAALVHYLCCRHSRLGVINARMLVGGGGAPAGGAARWRRGGGAGAGGPTLHTFFST